MNQLYKDGKKIIMRKIGLIGLFLCILLAGSIFLWGRSAKSFIDGSHDFHEYESYLYNTDENDTLSYAYIQADIEMITGSYAQYGEVKEDETGDQVVYYLMPIDNGEFFITVIGQGEITNYLDQMEESFYQSIGSDEKNYLEPTKIKGGFKKLNDEELQFAFDYFHGYDPSVETIQDLSNICSYYAITIDEIHMTSISGLQFLCVSWVILIVLIVICFIVYQSKVMMYPLNKDMEELSVYLYEQIDEDYANAKKYGQVMLGNRMLYVKTKITMHVYDYDRFIWLYHKEILTKKKARFEICAFDKQGKKYVLWQGEDGRKAERICLYILEHCADCMYGYQSHLYEFWQRYPDQLYEKCVEMSLLKEKQDPQDTVKKERRLKTKESKKKESRRNKKDKDGKNDSTNHTIPKFKKHDEDFPQFHK